MTRLSKATQVVNNDETLTLVLFVGALEGGLAFLATRVTWLGESDLIYLASATSIFAWVAFKAFNKYLRPILE